MTSFLSFFSRFARLGRFAPHHRTAWEALSNKSANVIAGVTKTLVIMRTPRLRGNVKVVNGGPDIPFGAPQS